MGYDGDIMLFSLDEYYEIMNYDIKSYDSIIDIIGDNTLENKRIKESIIYKKDRIQKLVDLIHSLQKPPEINIGKLYALYTDIKYYPVNGPTYFDYLKIFHLWDNPTGIFIQSLVPSFLKKYSNNVSEYWMRFIGDGSVGKIKINNEEFLMKRGFGVGFITGNELNELAEELYPILPHTNLLYEFLCQEDMDYYKNCDGVKIRVIELVYTLCMIAAVRPNKNFILTYLNDQADG